MSPAVRILVSSLVIAASVVVVTLVERLRPPPPPPPSQVESVFPFEAEAVSAIDLKSEDATLRAVRRDGRWRVESLALPPGVSAEGATPGPDRVNDEVAELVQNVVSLPEVARFPLERSAAEFGLDEPRWTVTLGLESGEAVTLEIGGRTTTGAGLYARIVGADEVLQIGGLILNELRGAFYQLRGLA